MFRSFSVAAIIIGGCVLAACGKSEAPPAETARPAAPATTPSPAATPATGVAKAANAASLFPEGAGRQLVLDTCGSCHPVACTARGQRTAAQWDRIRESHSDKVSGVSDKNIDVLFAYLKANFNDTKPEPQIPAEFLQQGCTPF
jgi:cytochrome c5